MSVYNVTDEEHSGEQATNQADAVEVEVEADDEELRPTVALSKQAKVDSEAIEKVAFADERDHPYGMTLVAEEKWEAREHEKAKTHERRPTQSTIREQGQRASVTRLASQQRAAFDERAASVDPACRRRDPREALEREELAAVNEQAERITQDVRESGSRAAVSKRLAERVTTGSGVLSASVAVMDAERRRAGTVAPIGELEEISREMVSIEGTVRTLFDSEHPAIQQVGLIEDETGTTKFTAWAKSDVALVNEGDTVRLRSVAKSWYNERVSVALTGESRVVVVEEA